MRKEIILLSICYLLAVSAKAQCSKLEYDKITALSRDVLYSYVNEYFDGGSNIRVTYDQGTCYHNSYTSEITIEVNISFRGNINLENSYTVDGVVHLVNENVKFKPLNYNQTAKSYLLAKGLILSGVEYALNYSDSNELNNKDESNRGINKSTPRRSIGQNYNSQARELEITKLISGEFINPVAKASYVEISSYNIFEDVICIQVNNGRFLFFDNNLNLINDLRLPDHTSGLSIFKKNDLIYIIGIEGINPNPWGVIESYRFFSAASNLYDFNGWEIKYDSKLYSEKETNREIITNNPKANKFGLVWYQLNDQMLNPVSAVYLDEFGEIAYTSLKEVQNINTVYDRSKNKLNCSLANINWEMCKQVGQDYLYIGNKYCDIESQIPAGLGEINGSFFNETELVVFSSDIKEIGRKKIKRALAILPSWNTNEFMIISTDTIPNYISLVNLLWFPKETKYSISRYQLNGHD